MGETTILRGGTIVNGYGVKQADIWIENGQISRVAPDCQIFKKSIKNDNQPRHIIDVNSFYILPGFLSYQSQKSRSAHASVPLYQQTRLLLEKGVTSLFDVIALDTWQGMERIDYLLTAYEESAIDYATRIGLTAELFTYPHVRTLRNAGHRFLELAIHSPHQLDLIDWDRLYPILSYSHFALALDILREGSLSQAEHDQLMKDWTNTCRYGNLRTIVQGRGKQKISENEYYQLHQLRGKEINEQLSFCKRNWFTHYPIFASLEDWHEPINTNEWMAEELLCMLVRLASTNIAKAAGIYPRKGCLAPGADADLLLIAKSEWLTNFDRSTILKISEICLPAYVMSKGKWQYVFGKHVHHNGFGQCLQDLKPYNYVI